MSIKTICYLSFGYPTIEKSIEMAGRYIEGGCDAIEVSIPPKDPYRDSAFLQELYRVALAQTDDYSKYLEGIGRMTEQYPSTEFFFVLYHEVIMAIGAEKLGEFCEKHHIVNVISGDRAEDHRAERIDEKAEVDHQRRGRNRNGDGLQRHADGDEDGRDGEHADLAELTDGVTPVGLGKRRGIQAGSEHFLFSSHARSLLSGMTDGRPRAGRR